MANWHGHPNWRSSVAHHNFLASFIPVEHFCVGDSMTLQNYTDLRTCIWARKPDICLLFTCRKPDKCWVFNMKTQQKKTVHLHTCTSPENPTNVGFPRKCRVFTKMSCFRACICRTLKCHAGRRWRLLPERARLQCFSVWQMLELLGFFSDVMTVCVKFRNERKILPKWALWFFVLQV